MGAIYLSAYREQIYFKLLPGDVNYTHEGYHKWRFKSFVVSLITILVTKDILTYIPRFCFVSCVFLFLMYFFLVFLVFSLFSLFFCIFISFFLFQFVCFYCFFYLLIFFLSFLLSVFCRNELGGRQFIITYFFD